MNAATPRARLHPAWLVVVPFVAFILLRELGSRPAANAVYCDEAAPTPARVTMLSATWCRYCTQARNWLVEHEVPYCEYDIERSATGSARYAAAELKVIPQIFIADRLLVGFNADELEQTLAAHDLLPMPDTD